ncbi:hypothetical protein SDC9_128108 [bioreactor metagenome]|uniref:Uncharacterized protein n=1 Tax=bioreactor metagenome TaxID=1076179 RepID=A0A645CV93_9ZZZZ
MKTPLNALIDALRIKKVDEIPIINKIVFLNNGVLIKFLLSSFKPTVVLLDKILI